MLESVCSHLHYPLDPHLLFSPLERSHLKTRLAIRNTMDDRYSQTEDTLRFIVALYLLATNSNLFSLPAST